jgi:hypothetical protein
MGHCDTWPSVIETKNIAFDLFCQLRSHSAVFTLTPAYPALGLLIVRDRGRQAGTPSPVKGERKKWPLLVQPGMKIRILSNRKTCVRRDEYQAETLEVCSCLV